MNNTLDRCEPGFFEADDEGYMQASEDAGPDGKAKGVEFCIYVQNPDLQLEHYFGEDQDFSLTDEEIGLWPAWLRKNYPGCDWNFDADEHAAASFYGDYEDGEDNDAIMKRLCVNNSDYNRVRNHHTIYYHGLELFLDHIKRRRGEA